MIAQSTMVRRENGQSHTWAFRRGDRGEWVGFLAGEFPDLDVLLRSHEDPLFGLAMHRHFTHSLLMAPVIGCLMAWLVMGWQRMRKRSYDQRLLVTVATAAALSHGLCDVWTSYGTRWFWPFSDQRVSWDLISVIDPLMTLPLLVMVVVGMIRRSKKRTASALCWVQQQRVLQMARDIAQSRGHEMTRITVKPSFANIVVWRVLYEHEGEAHILALRAGAVVEVMGTNRAKMIATDQVEGVVAGSMLAQDIERFGHFSDHWLCWYPEKAGILGDLRYAAKPDSVSPMWGILIDRGAPHAHVRFHTFRQVSGQAWGELWKMICGNR
jgi:inner membrane protein